MKELQYTPIVNGEMVTEEEARNRTAQDYINRIDKKYRLQRIIFLVVNGISTIAILMLIVLVLGR